jgi:ubiquinone/menaquinone biosynthesis C-methylase UbiE
MAQSHSHSHIFDVHKRQKLNSEERQKQLMPVETLKRLGYIEGATFADIGCGTGLFTFPASEIGGSSAIIYAVDISEEMLDDVRLHASQKGVANIVTVQSEPYAFKLDDGAANFILICTVLHEIDDKARFIKEAKRLCKTGGKIAVIEFGETDTGFGPPMHMRIKRSDAAGMLTEAGFTGLETLDISEAYYAVTGIG